MKGHRSLGYWRGKTLRACCHSASQKHLAPILAGVTIISL
jgi:hypothetical protein